MVKYMLLFLSGGKVAKLMISMVQNIITPLHKNNQQNIETNKLESKNKLKVIDMFLSFL